VSNPTHYDKKYFGWQKTIGEFGGLVNTAHIEKYCQPDFKVLDFGCGGGYLLANLNCKERIVIEINPAAQDEAGAKGIIVYTKTEDAPDEWADLIISDNALEHTFHPLLELQQLFRKLKKGGLMVALVPCESIGTAYKADDINQHLYSWSPLNIGNLFSVAGFKVISSKAYYQKWPPLFYMQIRKLFGAKIFNFLCAVSGRIFRGWVQVKVVVQKPE